MIGTSQRAHQTIGETDEGKNLFPEAGTMPSRLPVLPPIHFPAVVGPARLVGIQRDGVATVDLVLFTHLFVQTNEQIDWTIYMTFKELVVHMGTKGGPGKRELCYGPN